ncbi:hypothetical protein LCGC14_1734440 [marine sediment metagenome]|uniref:Uncharacterized protein n=1 Tax=marine sediment metagenome TaxID=412755 RepID=A0A0F9JNZ9_9ZZZZ
MLGEVANWPEAIALSIVMISMCVTMLGFFWYLQRIDKD